MITYHLRIIRSSLRIVANSSRYLVIITYYFWMIYGKINPWAIIKLFLTCQKNFPCFHGLLRMSPSCDELYADLRELYIRMLAIDYDLEIRKEKATARLVWYRIPAAGVETINEPCT